MALEPGKTCGHCEFCKTGRYNLCPDVVFFATPPVDGVFQEYVAHEADLCFKLPDNVSTMEGALVEPAAVGMHAAMEGGARLGKKIVILGAGCIGLMTLQGCKSLGATDIVVVDVMPKRLEMAKELGASAVINGMEEDTISRCKELVGELGADIVFETAGSQITAKQAPQIVARGGRIMIVGTIPGEVPIDFLKINREVAIQTVFRYANNYPMTIDAIASGKFDVKSMVTHVYDYQDVQKAFEESVHCKKDIIKGVIKIEDAQ